MANKYQIRTQAGLNKVIEAENPIDAIFQIGGTELNVSNVTGTPQEGMANTVVELLNGKKKSVNKYVVMPVIQKAVAKNKVEQQKKVADESMKRHNAMSKVIERIEGMDADDFIGRHVISQNKKTLISEYLDGRIPFKTNMGIMTLTTDDYRLNYANTSMGGGYDFQNKVREIKAALFDRLFERKLTKQEALDEYGIPTNQGVNAHYEYYLTKDGYVMDSDGDTRYIPR